MVGLNAALFVSAVTRLAHAHGTRIAYVVLSVANFVVVYVTMNAAPTHILKTITTMNTGAVGTEKGLCREARHGCRAAGACVIH